MFGRSKTAASCTAVEAIRVPADKEAAFIEWDRRYNVPMSGVPGFLKSETLAPGILAASSA